MEKVIYFYIVYSPDQGTYYVESFLPDGKGALKQTPSYSSSATARNSFMSRLAQSKYSDYRTEERRAQ